MKFAEKQASVTSKTSTNMTLANLESYASCTPSFILAGCSSVTLNYNMLTMTTDGAYIKIIAKINDIITSILMMM